MSLESCRCEDCVAACSVAPGGLSPEDVIPMATFLGLSPDVLINRYLIWDYYIDNDLSEMYFLRPVKLDIDGNPQEPTGGVASFAYAFFPGRCTFLTPDEKCQIHEVKPWNCRNVLSCDKSAGIGCGDGGKTNKAIADRWVDSEWLNKIGGENE